MDFSHSRVSIDHRVDIVAALSHGCSLGNDLESDPQAHEVQLEVN